MRRSAVSVPNTYKCWYFHWQLLSFSPVPPSPLAYHDICCAVYLAHCLTLHAHLPRPYTCARLRLFTQYVRLKLGCLFNVGRNLSETRRVK